MDLLMRIFGDLGLLFPIFGFFGAVSAVGFVAIKLTHDDDLCNLCNNVYCECASSRLGAIQQQRKDLHRVKDTKK